uniref:AAA family ATPase n=1 Tax=Streptomyces sp. CA-136453 TaxID=3240050 RepID=UPI003F499426
MLMTTATAAPPPRLQTRRPTGRVAWPIVVVAGAEKTGKSHLCAEFSASDVIGRTIWIPIGENDVDSFGALPGVRFEIADQHDGTFRSILREVRAAVAEPRGADGKPNAIVIDSISVLWELLSDEANLIARSRAAEKAARNQKPGPSADDDVVVGHALWNRAKDRWRLIIDTLRRHDGPVILCARLDEVTEFDPRGNPTRNRTWKVKAERNLPYDATAVVQLRSYRRPTLTAVRSLVMPLGPDEDRTRPGMTLADLMRDLGIERAEETRPAQYTALQPEAGLQEFEQEAERRARTNAEAALMRRHASEGTLPSPEEVTARITQALRDPDNPRSALSMVRTAYTTEVLRQVAINTKRGRVSASDAITALLTDLNATATAVRHTAATEPRDSDSTSTKTDAPPPNTEQGTPPTPPPNPVRAREATPSKPPSPRKPSPSEQRAQKVHTALRKEAEYQARVLSIGVHEHLADLIPPGADLEAISDYDLNNHLQQARPAVIAALTSAQEARTVEAYVKVSAGPCTDIDAVFADCAMLREDDASG